jgi:threonine synthase
MKYFSTNKRSEQVSFRQAVLAGQPGDKGLYFPENIPFLSPDFWRDFPLQSKEQIAFEVIKPYVGEDIDDETLFRICSETVNFDFPLVRITENISTLELFHGATLAFKDVGARFMSRCLRHFSAEKKEKTIVIVATSGDTGGAVANGFYKVDGVEVVILYPKGKVSRVSGITVDDAWRNIPRWKSREFRRLSGFGENRPRRRGIKNKVFLHRQIPSTSRAGCRSSFIIFTRISNGLQKIQDLRFRIQNLKSKIR